MVKEYAPENPGRCYGHVVVARLEAIAQGDVPRRGRERKHLPRCKRCREYISWYAAWLRNWRDNQSFQDPSPRKRRHDARERRLAERSYRSAVDALHKKGQLIGGIR